MHPYPKSAQLDPPIEREWEPPRGWYWCAAGCGTGLVRFEGQECLACRSGWTPDAAELERIRREYPK